MNYYFKAFQKYAVFSGRATRSEFWFFILFTLQVQLAFYLGGFFLASAFGASTDAATSIGDDALAVYVIASFLPTIAVAVRRLHDTGKSGWWLLLCFVPVAGIILYVFWAIDSQPGANSYGPNPKGIDAPSARIQVVQDRSV